MIPSPLLIWSVDHCFSICCISSLVQRGGVASLLRGIEFVLMRSDCPSSERYQHPPSPSPVPAHIQHQERGGQTNEGAKNASLFHREGCTLKISKHLKKKSCYQLWYRENVSFSHARGWGHDDNDDMKSIVSVLEQKMILEHNTVSHEDSKKHNPVLVLCKSVNPKQK